MWPGMAGLQLRGLGFDYYDLLKSAGGTQQCDPRDSACVAQNEQITDAVRALWTSQYMTNPDVANQPVPDVSVNLNTSPAALQQYMQNVPVTSETISVDSGPAVSAAQYLAQSAPKVVAPVPVVKAPAIAPAPASGPSMAPAAITPAGQTIVTSSGVQTAPGAAVSTSPTTGFSFGSIPWWGWAAGVGVALFAFGGGRGR